MSATAAATLAPCPDRLSEAQVAQYRRDGYLAFTDLLTPDEVQQARDAITELVFKQIDHPKAALLNGVIHVEGSELFLQFEPAIGQKLTLADREAIEINLRKLGGYVKQHPVTQHLAFTHQKVRGLIEGVLGPEPVLFQDMALIKPPRIGSEKPWHQDDAYFTTTPLDAVAGVWIALDAASAENGCMHVIPGGHKLGPLLHHHHRDCEIVQDRIDPAQAVPVELPAGGAMIFTGLLPHQTPPNTSDQRRRALQLHYRAKDARVLTPDEFEAIFVEKDGTPATCHAAGKRRAQKRAER